MIDGFIVDVFCHTAGLVVEIDGEIHAHTVDYDAERDIVLSARGLCVLRVRNDEILHDLPGVLASIAAACRRT